MADSIAEVVRRLVDSEVAVQESLAKGYANLSALARLLKPKVERILGKEVSFESILSALKRVKPRYGGSESVNRVIARSTLSVRMDLAKVSVEKGRRTLSLMGRLISELQESLIQASTSLSTITLIFDERVKDRVLKALGRDVLEFGDGLAAVIVQSPKEIVETPGCMIAFYSQLSREGINIEDTVSCYTDTIIVIKRKDVGRAFSTLSKLIDEMRALVGEELGPS